MKYLKYFESNIDIDSNQLKSLEYMPTIINGYFSCEKNKLTNLLIKSDIKNNINLSGNPLPEEILNNLKVIKEIIKFQNDYSIWNKDGSLNKNNLQELIDNI